MTIDIAGELLHRGGAASSWRNLGYWAHAGASGPVAHYASACAALADRVAAAAALADGDHVLSLGCGGGEELLHWLRRHGAATVVGIEQDARLAHAAHRLAAAQGMAPGRITVLAQSGLPQHSSFAPERFDAVLCVDAAHLFSPRVDWLLAAHASLSPGGRLAYTDLTRRDTRLLGWLLRHVAPRLGIAAGDLLPVDEQAELLRDIGFEGVQAEPLDEVVLGGFVRFVAEQSTRLGDEARSPAWREITRNAAHLRCGRALGLGCTLFSARKPR